jgi:adenylate cyclase
MRAGTRRRVALLVRVTLVWGVVIGATFGGVTGATLHDAALHGASVGVGMLAGSIQGALLVGLIFGGEIFLPSTRFGHALERAPFLVTLGTKFLAYGSVIALVVALKPGWRVVGAHLLPGSDAAMAVSAHIENPTGPALVRTLLLVAAGVLVIQLSRLIGERTLRDITLGRYHRPRTEERFFLFVDVAGSTPLAERIGPDAVHRFLGEVFALASDPIDDHHGDVHQYVGDEIVITWTVDEGRVRARPVACLFAIERALASAAPAFEREFGTAPRVRAALHAGAVITGEVGGSRRAVVYHGDVMNTTSRIEQATRDLGRAFLVSADALERLADLDGVALEDLGPQPLRGRTTALQIYAVTRRTSTDDRDTP